MTIESRIPWLENASRGSRWLADVSGGADSVALLHLLHRNGFRKIVVCHLNHRLRNEVFPLLTEITGRDPVTAFVRGAEDTAEREAFEAAMLDETNVQDPQGRLHVPAMRKLPPLLARLAVRRYLLKHGIADTGRGLLERAVSLLDPAGPPAVNLHGGGRLRRRAGRIWVEEG